MICNGGDIGKRDDKGGSIGYSDMYKRSAKPVLALLLDSYSLLKSIFVDISGPTTLVEF